MTPGADGSKFILILRDDLSSLVLLFPFAETNA